MKKLSVLLILSLLTAVAALSVSPIAAFAEDAMPTAQPYSAENNLLDGNQVRLEYHNYTMQMSGVYHAFILTYDALFVADYVEKIGGTPLLQGSIYTIPAAFFQSLGYSVSIDTTNTSLIAYINYSSMTDLYTAPGIEKDGYDNSPSTAKKKSSFLYSDYTSETTTVFLGMETEHNRLNNLLNLLYGQGVSRDKIELNYTYGTPYKIISSDAEYDGYSHEYGIYLHSFEMDMDSTDRIITIYQHSPNAAGWYALAIMIAAGVLAVPLVVYLYKRKALKGGQKIGD